MTKPTAVRPWALRGKLQELVRFFPCRVATLAGLTSVFEVRVFWTPPILTPGTRLSNGRGFSFSFLRFGPRGDGSHLLRHNFLSSGLFPKLGTDAERMSDGEFDCEHGGQI